MPFLQKTVIIYEKTILGHTMETHTLHIRLYRKLDLLRVIETPAAEWLRFNLQRENINEGD